MTHQNPVKYAEENNVVLTFLTPIEEGRERSVWYHGNLVLIHDTITKNEFALRAVGEVWAKLYDAPSETGDHDNEQCYVNSTGDTFYQEMSPYLKDDTVLESAHDNYQNNGAYPRLDLDSDNWFELMRSDNEDTDLDLPLVLTSDTYNEALIEAIDEVVAERKKN